MANGEWRVHFRLWSCLVASAAEHAEVNKSQSVFVIKSHGTTDNANNLMHAQLELNCKTLIMNSGCSGHVL